MKDKISKFLTAGECKKIKKGIICIYMIIFTIIWYANYNNTEAMLYIDSNIFSTGICIASILLVLMDIFTTTTRSIVKAILGIAKILYTVIVFISIPIAISIDSYDEKTLNFTICILTIISFTGIFISFLTENSTEK